MAVLSSINSLQKGGGKSSECDNKYHSDNTPVVALSTGWFSAGKRCMKNITIFGKGNWKANGCMAVDDCDSTMGCDNHHDCDNNIVDASKAAWKALIVPKKQWGQLDVFWSDATA